MGWKVLKGIFRTQSNAYDEVFLQKRSIIDARRGSKSTSTSLKNNSTILVNSWDDTWIEQD